jgi:signal transduction histidine kinase/ligand-binding sensor domain-containing protein
MATTRVRLSPRFRRKAALCALAFALAVARVWAIDPAAIAWRTLGGDQGFAGGAVNSIAQDSRGLIWIGAGDGLYRYDGQSFASVRSETWGGVLGVPSINRILADGRNGIWIAASDGVLRYDTLTGEFRRAQLADPPGERSLRIGALAVDLRGRVFAGANDGTVWAIEPESLMGGVFAGSGDTGAAITALVADARERIWVGTDGAGISLFDGEGSPLARYAKVAGGSAGSAGTASIGTASAGNPASDRVSVIMEDSLGFMWVGYADGGLDLFENGRFSHARRAAGAAGGRGGMPAVSAIAEDQQGRIWAGMREGGVGILDPSSMELSAYAFGQGREVSALLRDRRGLLWAGMRSGGLLTGDFRSANFQRFSAVAAGGPIGAATAMAKTPSGRLLAAGSNSGLVAFDAVAGAFAPATPLPRAAGGKAQAILALADGSLWLGMGGEGLVGRGPDGRIVRIASSYVLCLLEAGNGKIWAGTEGGGLDLVDPRTGEVDHWGYAAEPRTSPAPRTPTAREPRQPQSAPRLPASTITCLSRDSAGRIWAGTADAGLFVLEPGGARFRAFGRGGRSREGLGSLRVNAFLEDARGRLWVGMGGGGLAALDPRTETVIARASAAGLDDETIYGLAEDAQGVLWVAGSRGFYGYDPQRGDLFRYGPEDGLAPGGFGAGLVLADAEGRIWLGGEGGLTGFDPARVSRYGLPPDVIIADIETPGGSGAARRSPERDEIRLGYGNAGLRFTIAALDFSSSGRNRYAMMLEGRQSAWSDMGSMNSGYIAPLAPGRYMLRVRAANGNGVWNRYGASLAIVVSPPWWGAWWFRAASAAGLALLVVAGVMAAVSSLKRRNELLARFARHIEDAREEERTIASRDVHDEIGQHLMVLNFHAYWLAQHPEAPAGERVPVVAQLQKGVLDAMAAVKVVAARLRPVGLDTLDFPDVLKYYVRSFDRMSGIRTSVDIGSGWRDMPADTAKALFRLLQEMLSNVARHAKAGEAAVSFRADGESYLLEVRDDGVGIAAAKIEARDSFGIIGMREACAARGGVLSFASPPGGGCVVAARFPKAAQEARAKKAAPRGRRSEGR